jgi:Zn ribbon nucleic-acid-binding protein
VTAFELLIRPSLCPICAAGDAFVEHAPERAEYYVECVNCGVYRASRRAFRHFQYLRGKADSESLERLAQLANALSRRGRGAAIQLEYDTWQSLL